MHECCFILAFYYKVTVRINCIHRIVLSNSSSLTLLTLFIKYPSNNLTIVRAII